MVFGPTVEWVIAAQALIGLAIVCLTLGFNNLNGWGILTATDDAPFAILELSPAPLLVVLGIVLGQVAETDATPEQVDEAVQINVDARLDALRAGLLIMAGLAAVAIIPASRLPNRRRDEEIPDPSPG